MEDDAIVLSATDRKVGSTMKINKNSPQEDIFWKFLAEYERKISILMENSALQKFKIAVLENDDRIKDAFISDMKKICTKKPQQMSALNVIQKGRSATGDLKKKTINEITPPVSLSAGCQPIVPSVSPINKQNKNPNVSK